MIIEFYFEEPFDLPSVMYDLPKIVMEAADMYALGCISLSQLTEIVEENVPCNCSEADFLRCVLDYAEDYYAEYERQMNMVDSFYGC